MSHHHPSLYHINIYLSLPQHLRHWKLIINMEAQGQGHRNSDIVSIINEMTARRAKQCFLRKWDNNQMQWKQWDLSSSPKPFSHSPKQITTMTLNVLFDTENRSNKSKEKVIYSRERYSYIIKKTGKILPDVITFNEATPLFEAMLRDSEWVRKQYWISELLVGSKGFGNLILTKMEPIFFDKIKAASLPRLIQMIVLPINSGQARTQLIAFGSLHLTAYESKVERRRQEFNDLINYLQRYKEFVTQFVLQGDMNFHSQEEKQIFQPTHLRDAWTQLYDLKDNPGFTFNSDENSLINEIYWGFQRRKMRLDRILYTGNIMRCKQIHINFNEPIFIDKEKVSHHIFLKGGLLFVNDMLGLNFFRSEKERYLFASDHFGLIATFSIKQK